MGFAGLGAGGLGAVEHGVDQRAGVSVFAWAGVDGEDLHGLFSFACLFRGEHKVRPYMPFYRV